MKNIVKYYLILSVLFVPSLSHGQTKDKLFNQLTKATEVKSEAIIEKKKQDLLNKTSSIAVNKSKNYLETLFPTVEVSLELKENTKPTGGVLVVSPLSDPKNVESTTFTQGSIFLKDDRETVNLGLGQRFLKLDQKLLLGANIFYDHEFPYDHQRVGLGVEMRTSVGEINANSYKALTKWKNGADSSEERALGGHDIEASIPLPYINWSKASVRNFKWDGVDGASDLKGNDYSLSATILSFSIEAGLRDFQNQQEDEYFVKIFWRPMLNNDNQKFTKLVSEQAYTLTSMENKRYEKVKRENLIVKQKRRAGINLVAY